MINTQQFQLLHLGQVIERETIKSNEQRGFQPFITLTGESYRAGEERLGVIFMQQAILPESGLLMLQSHAGGVADEAISVAQMRINELDCLGPLTPNPSPPKGGEGTILFLFPPWGGERGWG